MLSTLQKFFFLITLCTAFHSSSGWATLDRVSLNKILLSEFTIVKLKISKYYRKFLQKNIVIATFRTKLIWFVLAPGSVYTHIWRLFVFCLFSIQKHVISSSIDRLLLICQVVAFPPCRAISATACINYTNSPRWKLAADFSHDNSCRAVHWRIQLYRFMNIITSVCL